MLAAEEDHVEHGLRPAAPGGAEEIDERVGLQGRHHEVTADVDDLGLADPVSGDVLDGEAGIGAGRADEAAVLALDVDDHGGGRAGTGDAVHAGRVDAAVLEPRHNDTAEGVVADAARDADRDAELDQVDAGIGRAAAEAELDALDGQKLTGIGHSRQGCAGHVGKEDSGAQALDRHRVAPRRAKTARGWRIIDNSRRGGWPVLLVRLRRAG